jgi:sigma-B regulation protein RsbQ
LPTLQFFYGFCHVLFAGTGRRGSPCASILPRGLSNASTGRTSKKTGIGSPLGNFMNPGLAISRFWASVNPPLNAGQLTDCRSDSGGVTSGGCLLTGSIFCMSNNVPFANPADAQSHLVAVGTNRIHYVTLGRGNRVFVLVHGWAGHLGFWREQVPVLAGHGRLVLIDLPGHGQSDKPRTDYTLDFFAGAVLGVLRDARVDNATFIGHSMGAAVLCRVHPQAPERFAALVSVDGLLRRPPGTPAEARALVEPFGSPRYLDHARNFIGGFFPFPGANGVRDRVMAEMLATPQHVMLGAMLGMFGPDQPDWVLRNVNAPVVVINAPSPWWRGDYEAYVHSLSPQSDYVMMADVGHFPMLEKPAAFNAALLPRLRQFGLIEE